MTVAMGFFILPLIMVVAGVAIFLGFGLIAHEGKDPADYLAEVNGRGINEPWQAAFHLSQQLNFEPGLKGNAEFANQLVRSLEQARESDARVRRYLVVALGQVGHPVAVPALIEHTVDEDAEVRVNSLWALGKIGDATAAAAVARGLRDQDAAVRTMSSYVLGILRDRETTTSLQVALNDAALAVRWNSAVALGLMEDATGLVVLRQMIDRAFLEAVDELTPQQRQQAMLAAIRALAALRPQDMRPELAALRRGDPDLKVREAARQALSAIETPVS